MAAIYAAAVVAFVAVTDFLSRWIGALELAGGALVWLAPLSLVLAFFEPLFSAVALSAFRRGRGAGGRCLPFTTAGDRRCAPGAGSRARPRPPRPAARIRGDQGRGRRRGGRGWRPSCCYLAACCRRSC